MSAGPGVLAVAVAAVLGGSVARPQAEEWRTDLTRAAVPLAEIVPGGPPRDGIPAIDRPRFESLAAAASWLADREPIIALVIGADARAYPLQILVWHEIVNDSVGGVPAVVTFCPLCNTALAFERTVGGRVLDFGTTGLLRYSDLVMYDRQTESWWQQATGEGIVGVYAGRRLRFLAAPVMSWRDFRASYPRGKVLSRRTGHTRPYGRNPYERYDRRSAPLSAFFNRPLDARLPAMERVVTVERDHVSVAYAFSLLERRRVVNDTVAGLPLAIFWAPGTASALDRQQIAHGRDVGATGVFERRAGGRVLSFEPADEERYRDRETGSVWDVTGRALRGTLAGERLTPVSHGNPFWFAWAAFRPDVRLLR